MGVLTAPAANSVLPSPDHATIVTSSDGAATSAGLVPAHALKGRSIENIDRRDVVVADRQAFAVRTVSDAKREISARRA